MNMQLGFHTEPSNMSQSKPEERLALELSCPICLQLFNEPVALPCGHNYCRSCIQSASDKDDYKSPRRCPECREEYGNTDSLAKNFKLSGIVDGFLAVTCGASLRGEPPVLCDQCLDGSSPAVKFCTRCEMALCSGHLKKHEEKHRSRHTLMEVLAERDGRRCPVHMKNTEYLCTQERLFLCPDCVLEGTHQHHDVQTFEVAMGEMKRVLADQSKTVSDKLQMTEVILKNAKERYGAVDKAEDKLVARANILLENMSALIRTYKNRMTAAVDDEFRLRDKSCQSNLSEMEGSQQQFQEALQCAREVLSQSSEFFFIQHYLNVESRVRQAAIAAIPSLPAQPISNDKHLRSVLQTDTFHVEMSLLLECLHGIMNPLDLTFNPATAHSSLLLSTDLKTVKLCGGSKNCTSGDSVERFCTTSQVMCSQGFSGGVHMWTVEIGMGCTWSVGLCYKSIARKGDHSRLGHNTSSWRLQWKSKKLIASHDSISVIAGEGLLVPPKKVEVTLDYEGGTVAFYSTGQGGRKQHLHTFSAVFKDVLYPAFGIHSSSDESWITLLNGA